MHSNPWFLDLLLYDIDFYLHYTMCTTFMVTGSTSITESIHSVLEFPKSIYCGSVS